MSLLSRKAPHVANVQRRTIQRNDRGIRVPVPIGDPIPVRGMAEPVRDWASAEESREGGLQILDMLVWRSKTWPGDVHSLIEFEGKLYEPVGAPQHHSTGRRTKHWRVTLRWLREA